MKPFFQLLLTLFLLAGPALAQGDAPDPAMERFRRGDFDVPSLMEILPRLADPAQREGIRGKLLEAEKPPLRDLVALLGHPLLAVRLGALEILEEMAGGDLSYNPWTPAESPENAAALARWSAWAEKPVKADKNGGIFSDDQRRSYLQDILGEDADKSARARRMLEAEGLSAVGFLEQHLLESPTLAPGHRARVREAQYQITLSRQLGDQAAVTARQLAFGSRDQVLSALTTVRGAGLLALPILRDFIANPDPLIRENAIDSLLVTGGAPAVEIVAQVLVKESDVNVIHGALRRLKDVPGQPTIDLVAQFLTHSDEDLLISAIQTSLSLAGENSSPFDSSGRKAKAKESPVEAAVIASLTDKRWRVRAAALEFIVTRSVSAAKDACLALLDDPDDFVRFAAIKAICALKVTEALPRLDALFMADEAMAGPVIEGYGALEKMPDEKLLARLDQAPPEARLAAIRATESASILAPLITRYAVSDDTDVACAALRVLSSDTDSVKIDANATLLVKALRSGIPEMVDAVLERLVLPKSKRIDPELMKALNSGLASSEPTALDPLYDAFLKVGISANTAPAVPTMPHAQEELVREIILRLTPETPPGLRFRAATVLAAANHPEGFSTLFLDLPNLTTAQKTTLAQAISEPSVREAMPLLTAMMRDPVSEVRSSAAEATLSDQDSPAFANLVFTELLRPGTPLRAAEVYGYRFESAVKSAKLRNLARGFGTAALASPDTDVPLRILATVALRDQPSAEVVSALKGATQSPDTLLRRAAWHALFKVRPALIRENAATVAADPEAFVRLVLPQALTGTDSHWSHHFTNLEIESDSRWAYDEKKNRPDEALRTLLTKLATSDPSKLVRFEAAFALLTQGFPIDLDNLVSHVPELPKETTARERISEWLSENAKRVTPGLSPLLAVIDPARIDADAMKILNERLVPKKRDGFATFASLAQTAAAPTDAPLLTAAPEDDGNTVTRESMEVIYFFKPGCPECARAQEYLKAVETEFPLLKVHEYNILEASGTLLNQALCQRFSVPSAKHTLSPAIFTQSGFLIREDITPPALAGLFGKTMATAQDDSWMKMDRATTVAAASTVDRRFAAFTLPVVIGAGLLDGVNPCAFATIIFFLSYLQIARRTPREMLMVGAAFISAVFIAYLAAGLVLYQTLAALDSRIAGIRTWLNLGFAALALIAAFLSFRDAWRARGGRLDEMTLQLPAFLKDRIRGTIRSGARARNFVIAAFVSGLVISLLELACTGQVYAPIIYQIQQGRLDAVGWLVIYNVAFILPLVVIFLLAYGGLRSETLIAVQKKHTTTVKIALGILFLVLAAIILVSQRWLSGV